MKPVIIRASALSGWPDCPRRGAARLFRREIVAAGFRLRRGPRTIGAAIGTAVHWAAKLSLDEKAKSGTLPPVSVATDAVAENLLTQIGESEIAYDGAAGGAYSSGDAVRQALAMTRSYHRLVAPQIEPILVEERLEADIPGAPGVVLSGQPDVVAREPHKIRDLKTGLRQRGSFAPQIGAYGLLVRTHLLDIALAAIDFLRRVKPGKPQPDPISNALDLTRAETAANNILRSIAADLATFRHGNAERRILPGDPWAFLANPSSVLCAAKWCSAHGTEFCHEWKVNDE